MTFAVVSNKKENMHPDIDRQTLIASRQKDESGNPIPHGYILPNGVVIVWTNGNRQNNLATIEFATAMFPNLIVMDALTAKPVFAA